MLRFCGAIVSFLLGSFCLTPPADWFLFFLFYVFGAGLLVLSEIMEWNNERGLRKVGADTMNLTRTVDCAPIGWRKGFRLKKR